MTFLLLAAALEVLRPAPDLEVDLEGGKLVFSGGMFMRGGVHYNVVEARGVGDFLDAAVMKGLIAKDRRQRVHTEAAARLMRQAEAAASRLMLLEAADSKIRRDAAGPERLGALERVRTERQVALGQCRRLARLRELAGVLNCR